MVKTTYSYLFTKDRLDKMLALKATTRRSVAHLTDYAIDFFLDFYDTAGPDKLLEDMERYERDPQKHSSPR